MTFAEHHQGRYIGIGLSLTNLPNSFPWVFHGSLRYAPRSFNDGFVWFHLNLGLNQQTYSVLHAENIENWPMFAVRALFIEPHRQYYWLNNRALLDMLKSNRESISQHLFFALCKVGKQCADELWGDSLSRKTANWFLQLIPLGFPNWEHCFLQTLSFRETSPPFRKIN